MKESQLNNDVCSAALEDLTNLLEQGVINEVRLSELKLKYPNCIHVIQSQYNTWEDLSTLNVPEPSRQMDARFYKTLSELEKKEGITKIDSWGSNSNSDNHVFNLWNSPWKWAIAASLFIAGLLVGRGFDSGQKTELPLVANQDNPTSYFQYVTQGSDISATDRLMAIQEIKRDDNPNDKIIEALYQALLNDSNINVRLTAVETLIYFADHPKARTYLIRAIPSQESALVQVALADAMLLLQEKKSVDAWEELLKSPNVEPDVKIHITERLESLL